MAAKNTNITSTKKVKAMQGLPALGVLFRIVFPERRFKKMAHAMETIFGFGFTDRLLWQINKIDPGEKEKREKELQERQKQMKGVHISKNQNLCYTHEVSCPECKRMITAGHNENISKCPHCKKEISMKCEAYNLLSSHNFLNFLFTQGYNWDPSNFNWEFKVQQNTENRYIFSFGMEKYLIPTEVELINETKKFISLIMGTPSYVHFHGNLDLRHQDLADNERNKWSLNLLPHPPTEDGNSFIFRPIVADVLNFLELPVDFDVKDHNMAMCTSCMHYNLTESVQCEECSKELEGTQGSSMVFEEPPNNVTNLADLIGKLFDNEEDSGVEATNLSDLFKQIEAKKQEKPCPVCQETVQFGEIDPTCSSCNTLLVECSNCESPIPANEDECRNCTPPSMTPEKIPT